MPIFKFIDEAVQTGVVIVVLIVFVLVVYLLWSLSPKVLGLLMMVAGVLIVIYFPHIQPHQYEKFTTMFIALGIISFIIGSLLVIFV